MRIVVASSYNYWGELDPDVLWGDGENRQIAGGETAMLTSAREWARAGHEVFLFGPCRAGRKYGIDWMPTDLFVEFVTHVDHDVMVIWDSPHQFRFADRAKVHICAFQLNDTFVGVFDHVIDQYWHPSAWHATRFTDLYREMNIEKVRATMTNGISAAPYQLIAQYAHKVPGRVVYTSSPDRGLHHLLRVFPRVRDAVPHAELHVYYDHRKWLEIDQEIGERNVTHDRAVIVRGYVNDPPPGVVFHGGVGKQALARAQMEAEVMAYPCDPVSPTEGFSMSVLEALTAGCEVVITNADAFEELWTGVPGVTMLPLPVHDDAWVDALVGVLTHPAPARVRDLTYHSWSAVAGRQLGEMNELLGRTQPRVAGARKTVPQPQPKVPAHEVPVGVLRAGD